MAHVILGLLMLWPQSLYELTKSFEAGVSLFYSSSTGSIKRALDKLLADGLIDVAPEQGPRGKRTYAITEAGRTEFYTFMRGPLTGPDSETAALSRLFFLGLLPPADRRALVEMILAHINDDLAELRAVSQRVDRQDVPEHLRDVARFQRATLDYGIDTHTRARAWFQALANDLGTGDGR